MHIKAKGTCHSGDIIQLCVEQQRVKKRHVVELDATLTQYFLTKEEIHFYMNIQSLLYTEKVFWH